MPTSRPLRILVHGINFAPELTGIGKYTGEMVAWLAERGHRVRVVTAPPYYPGWRIAPGHRNRYTRERRDGVEVWRTPLYVPARPGGLRRVLHHLSFAASALPVLLRQAAWRPDVVWLAAPSLACAPGAWVLARTTGAVACLHVQDLEVDAAFELGLLKGGFARRVALAIERTILRGFDRVSSISRKMAERLAHKGVPPERLDLVPNWADPAVLAAPDPAGCARSGLDLPPAAVVALYSGSIGHKQGFETLVDAARRLQDEPGLVFVFCGEGPGRAQFEQATAQLPQVRWLPLQPAERLAELLAAADIHLLPQRRGVSDLVLPSKLANMLASGRPVVCTAEADSDLARWVEGCGIVVAPDDAEALAAAVRTLAREPARRRQLGAAGRERARARLSRERALLPYFEALESRCGGLAAAPGADPDPGAAGR